MLQAYGVEACRATIVKEVRPVIACHARYELGVGAQLEWERREAEGWQPAPAAAASIHQDSLQSVGSAAPAHSTSVCHLKLIFRALTLLAPLLPQVRSVFGAYGIGVDPRHLSLIADYMTHLVRLLGRGQDSAAAAVWLYRHFECAGPCV